ncbi:MAG: deaminase [Candidatus Micrarchaeota archaeon]
MLVIGLTGENCAGKTTAVDYLAKKGFYPLSLSDFIREELQAEGKGVTRENLIKKGNELREKFGPSVLAVRAKEKMGKDKNYVIDSIRNPSEAEELKRMSNFYLLYITAEPTGRFERQKKRNREEDPKTLEAFEEIERLEMENAEKTKQNLKKTFALADKKIENNGDVGRFYESVDQALGAISKEFKMERPTWDAYFMNIAKQVATRSNCVKRKVAAVLVRDKQIISTGYNGTPRGTRNCSEGGCPRCNGFSESGKNLEECFCSHGEENAIIQAAYNGVSTKGCTVYTTFSPCLLCTKMIINSGILEVVYNEKYPIAESAMKLLREAGVKVRQYSID